MKSLESLFSAHRSIYLLKKILNKAATYTLFDRERNKDIMKALKIQQVLKNNQQLQTQTDTTRLKNGQMPTPIQCYEIPTSRKEEPRSPTEEVSGPLY
jgi:hypothetical protein